MSTPGRPRGNYAKTAARRRDIIDASLEVFSTSGYRSGSIREIAERVGLSQAGLLHHFSSKNELLAAVLGRRDELDRGQFDLAADLGVATIRNLIDLAEYNEGVRGLIELHCVLSAEATAADHPAHGYFVERYERVVGITSDALEVMASRGELIDGVDPRSTARDLIALMDGLQVQWLLENESFSMAKAMRDYVSPLLTIEL